MTDQAVDPANPEDPHHADNPANPANPDNPDGPGRTDGPRLGSVRVSRRTMVAGAAAVAGMAGMSGVLPKQLAAAAAAAEPTDFDLAQIKHVVYVMQENRSFDHYFGTFPGVRGFDDPTAMVLANGNSVFQQPDSANPDGYLEPFHMDTATTGAAAIPSLTHDWRDQHASWNDGAMDGWLHAHIAADGATKGSYTMGYMKKADIPFHWALAENFTLLDNYHCSVMGPTYPNRAIWMSGTNDPQGELGGPILETVAPNTLQWKSAAEVLYEGGYTVKTYTSSGSYNYFSWWAKFKSKGLVPDELYNRIMVNGTLFGDGNGGVGDPLNPTLATTAYLGFEEDCANGTLADVSWLFPDGPYASDEHPPNTPAAGAYFLASKLEALAANEQLWNSTVFIINYDENDGFFDHVPPPVPSADEYPEEYVSLSSPKGTPGGGLPVGAGFRVPCLIVSPWTVGGHIYSQVSDHTSPLRLIEEITAAGGLSGNGAVRFEAITDWRRATFDDLAGAFQTEAQDAPTDTEFDSETREANYEAQLAASTQPMPALPGATQSLPHQEDSTTSTEVEDGTVTAAPDQTPTTAAELASAAAKKVRVKVTATVMAGHKAAVTLAGLKAGSTIVVRNARGKLVLRAHANAAGRATLKITTKHLHAGKHGFTLMFVDTARRHHTNNIRITVKARHRGKAHRSKH
ncbi:MAG: alkaline phosphatase family protein [Nocardioides sp.]|uniref:alkaline phosphatase family protein n=1 Tax=Nocardioides sp. TaxID=35761 RepID=UPI0039E21E2B